MSEFFPAFDRIIAHQVDAQVARSRRSHPTAPPRRRGRQALARRLHHLADRLAG